MGRRRKHPRNRNGVDEKHGRLYLDFVHRGVRCKEYVTDAATAENRTK